MILNQILSKDLVEINTHLWLSYMLFLYSLETPTATLLFLREFLTFEIEKEISYYLDKFYYGDGESIVSLPLDVIGIVATVFIPAVTVFPLFSKLSFFILKKLFSVIKFVYYTLAPSSNI